MAHWYLIHGAASSRLTWTKQLRALASVERAELPPLDHIPPDHLIEAWADWCLSHLTQPSVIVGHSMGGAIAQVMALKRPSLVQGLVLAGTGPHLPVNPDLIAALKAEPDQALNRIARWSMAKTADPILVERSLEQMKRVDPNRAYREFLACTYFDVRPDLARIACPRAVIAGAEDRMTPAALTSLFRDVWPAVPYFTIPDAGHMMMLEQSDRFNEVLADLSDQFNW